MPKKTLHLNLVFHGGRNVFMAAVTYSALYTFPKNLTPVFFISSLLIKSTFVHLALKIHNHLYGRTTEFEHSHSTIFIRRICHHNTAQGVGWVVLTVRRWREKCVDSRIVWKVYDRNWCRRKPTADQGVCTIWVATECRITSSGVAAVLGCSWRHFHRGWALNGGITNYISHVIKILGASRYSRKKWEHIQMNVQSKECAGWGCTRKWKRWLEYAERAENLKIPNQSLQ